MARSFGKSLLCAALAALALVVPSTRASAGEPALRVASDVSYAPLEFYRPHTKQIVGFDYDLAQAIGKHMARRVSFVNHDFATLLPRLKAGDYDLAMSALSDTLARERDVDFVDYLLSGTGMLTKAGNPAHLWDIASLCGHTVDVQKGTAQEAAVRDQQAKCKSAGLGDITVLAYDTDDAAFAALTSGKSVAHLSDYPVIAYLARTTPGYTMIGREFRIVPYGIAVAKHDTRLRDAVHSALLAVVADGTYDTLIAKWNLQQGAIRSAAIDAGPVYAR